MKIKTEFKKIIYKNPPFAILKDINGDIYKGEINLEIDAILHSLVLVEYEEEFSQKYGISKNIKSLEILEEPIFFFFKNIVKTIPKQTIREIVKTYTPQRLQEILEFNPEELLKFKQIGKKRLLKIKEKYENYKNLLELIKYLSPFGISTNLINKIYEKYKNASINIIKNNPYLITEIKGVGFKKADEVALKLGVDKKSDIRIESAIMYYLKESFEETKNTIIKKEELEKKVNENLGFYVNINSYIIKRNELVTFIKDNQTYITYKYLLTMEEKIFKIFNKIPKNYTLLTKNEILKKIKEIETNKNIQFSEKQKEAIIEFTTTKDAIFILAGYAGSGKTTIAKTIMDAYAEKFGKNQIVACALSGNASNRIKNVTGYNAFTIHSLLGINNKNTLFDEYNPLPYELIVLDEASMVDLNLFYKLIKAIDFNKTKLFIIGDDAQLLPVGLGEPFNDILQNSKAKKIILDKVFRQNENKVINIFAQEIRKGIAPKNFNKKYEDFYFINIEVPYSTFMRLSDKERVKIREEINNKILQTIQRLYKTCNKKMETLKNSKIKQRTPPKELYKFLIEYIQIITPKKDGVIGVKNLNKAIKELVNPLSKDEFEKELFIGGKNRYASLNDKIIHLVNINKQVMSLKHFLLEELFLYDEINLSLYDLKEKRVFNGQMGVALKVYKNENETIIAVYYPNEDYVVFYNENEFEAGIIDLAYAITIHKSQGSEYKNVFIPISYSNFHMLNNKLLYTAVTRAKNFLCMIGESSAFKKGCGKIDITKRKTNYKILAEKNLTNKTE